jgi:hypothetical protein
MFSLETNTLNSQLDEDEQQMVEGENIVRSEDCSRLYVDVTQEPLELYTNQHCLVFLSEHCISFQISYVKPGCLV